MDYCDGIVRDETKGSCPKLIANLRNNEFKYWPDTSAHLEDKVCLSVPSAFTFLTTSHNVDSDLCLSSPPLTRLTAAPFSICQLRWQVPPSLQSMQNANVHSFLKQNADLQHHTVSGRPLTHLSYHHAWQQGTELAIHQSPLLPPA